MAGRIEGKVAALELGHHGVRVSALAPGLVGTNATSASWPGPGIVEGTR